MDRIPERVRIFLALAGAFICVYLILPKSLTEEPVLPSREEIAQLLSIPNYSLTALVSLKQTLLKPAPTPAVTEPFGMDVVPTAIPTVAPIRYDVLPTAVPALPTTPPTPTAFPLRTATRIPTVPIEKPIPSATPYRMPTATPFPTVPKPSPTAVPPTPIPTKSADYSSINEFTADSPQIGCRNNTTAGCPVDALYQTPLEKGLGWATYYGDEHNAGYNVVADVIHNNKGITVDAARKFINDNYMEKQSDLTPEQARKTGKVIAFGATRTPKDLWKIKYLFGIDDPKHPKARFIGRIMIIDCAAVNDWKNNLSTLSYGYLGWSRLNWIVDLSKNGFIKLPTGYSGRPENIGEGRPGVILVDESAIDGLIY